MTNRYRPNEPTSPVPLELLALLMRSSDERITEIVAEMPMLQRATLALYCNARSHMRRIGFAIVASCTEHALYEIGGTAGLALFEQAREERETRTPRRRSISLARSA